MENLAELLIASGAFGLAGLYLFIVSRFIREGERETSALEAPSVNRPHTAVPAMRNSAAHAH